MYLTEKIACFITKKARSVLNFDDESEEIMIYGAIGLIQTINAILLVSIVGAMLGVFYEALIVSFTGAYLRKYSGGVHASSPGRCLIIGTSFSVIMGLVVKHIISKTYDFEILIIIIITTLISYTIIKDKAPLDSENKLILDIDERNRFKQKSILIIVSYTCIMLVIFIINIKIQNIYLKKTIGAIALGMLWQAMTLNKLGVFAFQKIDLLLKFIMEGGKKNERKNCKKIC